MQIRQIQKDRWYQTSQGIGLCRDVKHTTVLFEIGLARVWVGPKDVEYELPKDQIPKKNEGPKEPASVTIYRLREVNRELLAACIAALNAMAECAEVETPTMKQLAHAIKNGKAIL